LFSAIGHCIVKTLAARLNDFGLLTRWTQCNKGKPDWGLFLVLVVILGFSQAIGAATLFPGVLYYVIVRGNQRQKIFADHFVATRACAAMV
jgi:predicted LPLAT superfamily acyltransferase